MAWRETATGRRYYYQVRWVNGRPVPKYIGTGKIAEAAAAEDALRRVEREIRSRAWKEEVARQKSAQKAVLELFDLTDLLFRATLLTEGFHQHARSTWRDANMSQHPIPSPKEKSLSEKLRELICRAQRGDESVMPDLRQRARRGPQPMRSKGEIWRRWPYFRWFRSFPARIFTVASVCTGR